MTAVDTDRVTLARQTLMAAARVRDSLPERGVWFGSREEAIEALDAPDTDPGWELMHAGRGDWYIGPMQWLAAQLLVSAARARLDDVTVPDDNPEGVQ